MMVIDASAAIGMLRAGQSNDDAYASPINEERTIAPAFFRIEAAQVAWKYAHIGMLDDKGAQEMLRDTINYVDEFYEDGALVAEALSEAVKANHSFYDMLYFVLAKRMASPLVTCDHKLASLCANHKVECIELANL